MRRSAVAAPSFDQERALWTGGCRCVAGVDEAGRGALAGPVVAAAVVVAPEDAGTPVWSLVRDSKLLTPAQRKELEREIQACALTWAVGAADAATVDNLGIASATRLAMSHAIAALKPPADFLLIDWVRLPQLAIPQRSQSKADRDIVSVAAASILAKVHRDRWMVALHEQYPQYGFAGHKGYGAAAHLAALDRWGPCPEHRRSFAPLAQATLFPL
jgi:ribonuclease HII